MAATRGLTLRCSEALAREAIAVLERGRRKDAERLSGTSTCTFRYVASIRHT